MNPYSKKMQENECFIHTNYCTFLCTGFCASSQLAGIHSSLERKTGKDRTVRQMLWKGRDGIWWESQQETPGLSRQGQHVGGWAGWPAEQPRARGRRAGPWGRGLRRACGRLEFHFPSGLNGFLLCGNCTVLQVVTSLQGFHLQL